MSNKQALLSFANVDGYDVYNTSIPFVYQGDTYIFGRVEKRTLWATSHVRLFMETAPDAFTLVPGSMVYPLEDPCITMIGDEFVLCGTHVQKSKGEMCTYHAYFYRGRDPFHLEYFTTGPAMMKDIRLVQLHNGRIGVFSRPRGDEIEAQHGSNAIVGYTTIASLDQLDADVIAQATKIDGLFQAGEWGGSNQCYALNDGTIGIIGHKSRNQLDAKGIDQKVYDNIAFHFDPATHTLLDCKVIATRESFPPYPCKVPDLARCAFASGIVLRPDGLADLYSGLGDTCEGRVAIKLPF